jgi:hypothetical protein
VELAAKPFELPAGAVAHELFGMKLIDIDDTIRKQISLHSSSRVMVLEPGPNAARLGLDDLQAGDAFWMAGNKRIKNFADFAQTIVGECKAQQQRGETSFSVRVVYNFDRLDRDGSNTQHLKLTPDDLKELMKVAGP